MSKSSLKKLLRKSSQPKTSAAYSPPTLEQLAYFICLQVISPHPREDQKSIILQTLEADIDFRNEWFKNHKLFQEKLDRADDVVFIC